MKRCLSLLLAACLLLALFGCVEPVDPSTQSGTEPSGSGQTNPQPTDSNPTEPEETSTIYVEAEKPVRKNVDLENRTDVNGNPMDHTYRADLLGADGLHYANDEKTSIVFSAFDSYTYSFHVDKAGEYRRYIVGSCDRDSPISYNINGTKGIGYFVRNDFQGYDQVELAVVNLVKGFNTLTVTITENKNHNLRTDRYILVLGDEGDGSDSEEWSAIIDAAAEAEKISPQEANPVWKELYVSADGKDSNDGSANAPSPQFLQQTRLSRSSESKCKAISSSTWQADIIRSASRS